jgi:hypothetical protein
LTAARSAAELGHQHAEPAERLGLARQRALDLLRGLVERDVLERHQVGGQLRHPEREVARGLPREPRRAGHVAEPVGDPDRLVLDEAEPGRHLVGVGEHAPGEVAEGHLGGADGLVEVDGPLDAGLEELDRLVDRPERAEGDEHLPGHAPECARQVADDGDRRLRRRPELPRLAGRLREDAEGSDF